MRPQLFQCGRPVSWPGSSPRSAVQAQFAAALGVDRRREQSGAPWTRWIAPGARQSFKGCTGTRPSAHLVQGRQRTYGNRDAARRKGCATGSVEILKLVLGNGSV